MAQTPDIASVLKEDVPKQANITPYDRAHLATYLSLLHASGEGLTLDEMARAILGLDPKVDPDGARAITENHLARARWLATTGRKHLLEIETDNPAEM
jgi:hypothetical protein